MNYNKMTVKELKELAAERGVTIPSAANKAQIIAALQAEAAPEAETADEQEAAPETAQEAETADEQEAAPETAQEAETATEPEKPDYMAYVGPSLPGGQLSFGKILYGTKASIRAYLAPILEKHPKITGLLVPMEGMNKAMKDVKNPDKLLYHLAAEVADRARNQGGETT